MGGTIAHEIAVQLETEGEEVALLAMLDSSALPEETTSLDTETTLRGLLKDTGISEDAIPDGREEQLLLLRELLIDRGLVPALVPIDWVERVVTQMVAAPRLLSAHDKGCCNAPILMFRATLGDTPEDPEALNWQPYSGTGQVDIPIAARHTAMLDPEPSAEITRTLAAYLLD
jgi:thioesterase domain-containing protein